jgi:hypothetical protein
METEIESYLCKSVLVQKGLPKPLIHQRERSQSGAVMCRREEAGQLHSGGVSRRLAGCASLRPVYEAWVPCLRGTPGGSYTVNPSRIAGHGRCHLEKMDREFNR